MNNPSSSSGFRPVATAGPRISQLFLLDTLKDQDTIQAVLENYQGIFAALRGQPVHYIILVTFDIPRAAQLGIQEAAFRTQVASFATQVQAAVPPGSRLDLRMLSTDEMCALLRQGIPNTPTCQKCVDCDSLQFPSIFGQDPFIALDYGPDFLTMLSSVVSPVAFSYSFVAGAIANGEPHDLRLVYPTRLNLVGGNLLPQPDYAIVGQDTYLDNQNNPLLEVGGALPSGGYEQEAITEQLRRQLGVKKIFWTGTSSDIPSYPYFQQGKRQPAFHVDFYLTPAGPQVDPQSGERYELIFVGQLELYAPQTDRSSANILQLMARGLEEAARYFAGQTTPAGLPFRVVRIPLLFVGINPERTVINKLLSFNQVLLQSERGKTTVFLPDYTGPEGGAPAPEYAPWQQKAIEIYTAQGFEVVVVKGRFRTYSFYNGGSLHCMAKITARGDDR
ncbi:MAG: hypothetical protein AAGN35_07025 [Bacteroidota bacterium]